MDNRTDRFNTLMLSVESIRKSIGRIKNRIVSDAKLKSVHALWIYKLYGNSEGLTASELASKSGVDRSLVSRELNALVEGGFIIAEALTGRRNYNFRITLTDKGRLLAEDMIRVAIEIQNYVSSDISREELLVFYSVLERIENKLENVDDKLTEKEGNLYE